MSNQSVTISVPQWVWERADGMAPLATLPERMQWVIDLAQRNIADGGGPFAAAIFDGEGRLVAPGVNRVVASSTSVAHAEIVAIALAGQRLQTWDLAAVGHLQLVTTTEPCAMCLGAVPWSGVTSLICGARDADARSAGFDEGHKPLDWVANLESAGIEVVQDVERDRAAAVLASYASDGGTLYNGSAAQ